MRIAHHFRATLERWRFRYGPAIADAIASLSTIRAKVRLSRRDPLSVLVDNTVLYHAVAHETAWVSTGTAEWGPHRVDTGYAARISVHRKDDTSREYLNVRYLPGIAHLARAGYLSLMTSAELMEERFRQPIGRFAGYGLFDHSLLAGIKIKSVDGFAETVIGPQWMTFPSSADQQRARLTRSNDQLYLGLVKQLGTGNTQDAWHIRTAELHGHFCFLTMDFALCKNFDGRRSEEPIRSLRTRVMTPLEFSEHLGLFPVHPNLFSYADASYPVRADLSWEDGKRHRRVRRRGNRTKV